MSSSILHPPLPWLLNTSSQHGGTDSGCHRWIHGLYFCCTTDSYCFSQGKSTCIEPPSHFPKLICTTGDPEQRRESYQRIFRQPGPLSVRSKYCPCHLSEARREHGANLRSSRNKMFGTREASPVTDMELSAPRMRCVSLPSSQPFCAFYAHATFLAFQLNPEHSLVPLGAPSRPPSRSGQDRFRKLMLRS